MTYNLISLNTVWGRWVKFTYVFLMLVAIFTFTMLDGSYIAVLYLCFVLSLINVLRFAHRFFIFSVFFFMFLFPFDFMLTELVSAPLFPGYKTQYISIVFLILCIFQGSCLLINAPKESFVYRELEFIKDKWLLVACFMFFAVGLYMFKGESIFSASKSYSTYQANIKNSSGLNEYLLIFSVFILFIKKSFLMRCFFVGLLGVFVTKAVFYGFRVQAIMGLLVIFITVFKQDPPRFFSILIMISGFFVMLIFGFMKEGADIDNFSLDLLVDVRYGYAQSHQHGVLSSSTVILSHSESLSLEQKLATIPALILASTVPRRFLNDLVPWVYPSSYVQTFEYTPGGGLFIIQIYFLLGVGGIIVFLVSFVSLLNYFSKLNVISKNKDKYILVLIVYMFVFMPRWISYDFFNYGLRGCFLIFLLVSLHSLLKYKRDVNNG